MKLTFSPVRMEAPIVAHVEGDVLTLNKQALDFGPLPKGAVLPRAAIDCPWIAGDVVRDAAGLLIVPLVLPHGGNPPTETLFPADLLTQTTGPVALPVFDRVTAQDVSEKEDAADDH